MIDPVTLSALAGSFATGAASAIGAEMGKDVYRAVSRGMSYCQCRSQEVTEEVTEEFDWDSLPEDIREECLLDHCEEMNVRTLTLRQAP